ncbi:MAG: hypothetical protein GC162_10325 [Planctomycetes bacterium]|nr:hypothetical protein [Planctomycetota bacterium]
MKRRREVIDPVTREINRRESAMRRLESKITELNLAHYKEVLAIRTKIELHRTIVNTLKGKS